MDEGEARSVLERDTTIFDAAGKIRLTLLDLPNSLGDRPVAPTHSRKTLTDELQKLTDRQKELADRLQKIDGQSEKDIELRQTLTDQSRMLTELQKTLTDQLHTLADRSPTPSNRFRTATIGEVKNDQGINPGNAFLSWLQRLKDLGDKPEKVLGKKELDGKQVTGFVVRDDNRTFTMWIDNATGEPVRIEYDWELNGAAAHVTMKDFHFHLALDESLFSFDVPPGYKISGLPENGKIEPPAGLELAWSIEGSWVGVTRAPKIWRFTPWRLAAGWPN